MTVTAARHGDSLSYMARMGSLVVAVLLLTVCGAVMAADFTFDGAKYSFGWEGKEGSAAIKDGDQNVNVDAAIKNSARWIRELQNAPVDSVRRCFLPADAAPAAGGPAASTQPAP